jgi:hypothetical protein
VRSTISGSALVECTIAENAAALDSGHIVNRQRPMRVCRKRLVQHHRGAVVLQEVDLDRRGRGVRIRDQDVRGEEGASRAFRKKVFTHQAGDGEHHVVAAAPRVGDRERHAARRERRAFRQAVERSGDSVRGVVLDDREALTDCRRKSFRQRQRQHASSADRAGYGERGERGGQRATHGQDRARLQFEWTGGRRRHASFADEESAEYDFQCAADATIAFQSESSPRRDCGARRAERIGQREASRTDFEPAVERAGRGRERLMHRATEVDHPVTEYGPCIEGLARAAQLEPGG